MTDGEREAADAALRALQERLQQALRRFADAVHEVNNIAATVKGELDMAVEHLEAIYRQYPELRP